MDVEVDGETFRVEIERAHMEEDTGKSLHVGGATGRIHGADYSLVDYNRAGIPLIEIVTKPIIGAGEKAPEVARAYVQQLRDLIVALGVSEARMDQGNLRADVNLSLAPQGLRRARHPHRDQERQLVPLGRAGGALRDAAARRGARRGRARSSRRPGTGTRTPASPPAAARSPTPTTTATSPSPTWCRWRRRREWVEELRGTLPENPTAEAGPAAGRVGLLRPRDARHRRRRRARAGRGDRRRRRHARRPPASGGSASSPGAPTTRASTSPTLGVTPAAGGRASRRSSTPARSTTSWPARSSTACSPARARPEEIVAARGLAIVSDEGALGAAVDNAIAANPDVADKIRDGKVAAAGALIGAVMKEMRGQADAGRVRELILESSPEEIVAASGLAIVSDEGALSAAVDNAIAANPDVADKIRDGKVAAAGALIGALMKEMHGQADAGRVRELILERLHLSRQASTLRDHHHIHARGGGSRSESGADPQP